MLDEQSDYIIETCLQELKNNLQKLDLRIEIKSNNRNKRKFI